MLTINPFYFLLVFYILINFIFACIGFTNNYVEIEFSNFYLNSLSFFYAFLIQFFVCIFLFTIYLFFEKKSFKSSYFFISKNGSILLLLLQILFLTYNIIYGINIAGLNTKSTNSLLNAFFILIPADILFILLSPYIKSSKWFYLNLILYIISNTLRGWMGGLFLALVVAVCRKEVVKVSFKFLIWTLLSFIVLLLLLPYLSQIKWVIRSEGNIFDAIKIVNDNDYYSLLNESIYYVFNRFQHNYHVALLIENHAGLSMKYDSGKIMYFWLEGIIQGILASILHLEQMPLLGTHMANDLFYSEGSWSSNPGLSGWLIILKEKFILLIIYVWLILFLGFYNAVKFFDRKMLLILGTFSVIYLFHGWIGSYVSLVTYLLIITFIKRIKI